jgi:hypothetical protein
LGIALACFRSSLGKVSELTALFIGNVFV